MPLVFRHDGYRFFFYSNEGSPREPVHIHIRKGREEAKLWLRPVIKVAYNEGFDARTLRSLVELTALRAHEIEDSWREHFAD